MSKAPKTPVGTVKWADLINPVVFGGKAPTPEEPGRYSVTLLLDPDKDETQDFLDDLARQCDEAFQAAMEEKGNPKGHTKAPEGFLPISEDLDKDEKSTGLIQVRAAKKAGGVRKDGSAWTRKIPMSFRHARDRQEIEDGASPGYGTRLMFTYDIHPYQVVSTKMWKISLQLRAVFIEELQARGGSDASNDFADMEEEDFD